VPELPQTLLSRAEVAADRVFVAECLGTECLGTECSAVGVIVATPLVAGDRPAGAVVRVVEALHASGRLASATAASTVAAVVARIDRRYVVGRAAAARFTES
jgi:hypothetical protein